MRNRSVEKAFDILRCVSLHHDGIGLSEVSRAMGLDKATVFRYLNTMETLEILEKKDNRYYLGMGLFELGNHVPGKRLIVNGIHPALRTLCEEVNETVNLAVLYNDRVLYLDKIESRRSLQINSMIGGTVPLHCTALGKCILSILPDQRTKSLLARLKLDRLTARTITDRRVLWDQIALIRDRNIGLDREEYEEGLICVAVPLRISSLDFYGAISLSGPVDRFTDPVLSALTPRLQRVATELVSRFDDRRPREAGTERATGWRAFRRVQAD